MADLRAGAQALLARAGTRRLVGADIACSLVYGALTVLLLLVAGRLGLGADGYGYLLGAMGLGGVVGAAVAGPLGREDRQPAALVGALLCVAVPLPLLGVTHALVAALALSFVGGLGAITVEILVETSLQRSLPADVLGRAYGFALPAALSGIVAGSLIAPALVALAGLAGALALLGAAVALIAVATLVGGDEAVVVQQPEPLRHPGGLHA
jgi:MFS family permease